MYIYIYIYSAHALRRCCSCYCSVDTSQFRPTKPCKPFVNNWEPSAATCKALNQRRIILLLYIFLFFLRFTISAAVSERFTNGLQGSVGRAAHALRRCCSCYHFVDTSQLRPKKPCPPFVKRWEPSAATCKP